VAEATGGSVNLMLLPPSALLLRNPSSRLGMAYISCCSWIYSCCTRVTVDITNNKKQKQKKKKQVPLAAARMDGRKGRTNEDVNPIDWQLLNFS
jgi:hypothetical protein